MTAFDVSSFPDLVGQVAYLGSFTEGATAAFLVGVFLMLTGSAVVWAFLDVKHEELATDGPEAPLHVGLTPHLRTTRHDDGAGPPGLIRPGGLVQDSLATPGAPIRRSARAARKFGPLFVRQGRTGSPRRPRP